MPLRNRVTPFNEIVSIAARGTLMGNRGRLHDADRTLSRRLYTTRAWVACLLRFNNRHRPVMQPNRYTELFFLDEPTALAAGHRPCGQCRYADYHRFLAAWRAGNDRPQASLAEIDAQLQDDRLDKSVRRQKRFSASASDLPDGAMVSLPLEPGAAFLIWQGRLMEWAASGYHSSRTMPASLQVEVLTPRSTVKALAAGYRPVPHPTAKSLLG